MKRIKGFLKGIAGILLAGLLLPFYSYAEDDPYEVYYSENGNVDVLDSDGCLMYYLNDHNGYGQRIDFYILAEELTFNHRAELQFTGFSDYAPEGSYGDDSSGDIFLADMYPVNMTKISDWGEHDGTEPHIGIYKMSLSVTPGKYSLLVGCALDSYRVRFRALTTDLEPPERQGEYDYYDPALWWEVPAGGCKRVYGIYHVIDDGLGGEYTFYEDNIEEFEKWAEDYEAKLLGDEASVIERSEIVETVEVATPKEEIESALEDKKEQILETVETVEPVVIEESEPEDKPVSGANKWERVRIFVIPAVVILFIVIIFLIFFLSRRRR